MKVCVICGKQVNKGEGMYYIGRLIHRKCLTIAGMKRFSLMKEKLVRDKYLWFSTAKQKNVAS